MAVVIRLQRAGKKRNPSYKIVAADKRCARDGRFIEALGTYNPGAQNPAYKHAEIKTERVKYWMDNGAKPSPTVASLIKKYGAIAPTA